MSNVLPMVWRGSCPLGLRTCSRLLPATNLRNSILSQQVTYSSTLSSFTHYVQHSQKWRQAPSTWHTRTAIESPATIFRRSANTDAKPETPTERGITLDRQPLSASEMKKIFGSSKVTVETGNRILSLLQGRRFAGTLDMPFPPDITKAVRPKTIEKGLHWLRENYSMDEDAAIMARIEREEKEEEERLYRQVQQLGPQSGHWGARLGEGEDIYGESIIKKNLKQNEARLLAEEEKARQEWLESELKEQEKMQSHIKKNTQLQKYTEAAVVEARPRADPKERPFLAWAQKHYLRAENTNTDFNTISTAGRILPALGVTLLTLGLCYIYADTYVPPNNSTRMWPDIPPAAATVFAIIGVNVAVYCLWKIPPAWRLLNRYFISVPLYPYALSVVGSVFSHQQFKHLATNTLILWLIGSRLHDEIQRGNFLAVYLSAGVFGSITSLTAHVLLGKLTITSLGASGAIAGLVGSWCMLHADHKLVPSFLPHEWREYVAVNGSTVLAGIVAFEILSLISPFKVAKLDHWAHLGGYFAGAVWATLYKSKLEKEKRRRREARGWLDRFAPSS
ncbi:putative rhomboid family protein [Talaromyces proteolyticus]|uniref:Rhomboid family protein n=1 Tax=Talaromyces proteolyticus TaxID=1131652 RepID=A0AAD4KK20_9EURO|nr:putative rhomboid family protein [Talaromyces proteolyticus]KAH8693041.1 putative rhomboid family protein [Talaromyces proteolyticus]